MTVLCVPLQSESHSVRTVPETVPAGSNGAHLLATHSESRALLLTSYALGRTPKPGHLTLGNWTEAQPGFQMTGFVRALTDLGAGTTGYEPLDIAAVRRQQWRGWRHSSLSIRRTDYDNPKLCHAKHGGARTVPAGGRRRPKRMDPDRIRTSTVPHTFSPDPNHQLTPPVPFQFLVVVDGDAHRIRKFVTSQHQVRFRAKREHLERYSALSLKAKAIIWP